MIFQTESGPGQHFFTAENERRAKQWVSELKKASYQTLREKLINLQIILRQKTSCDPLRGNMIFREIMIFRQKFREINFVAEIP